MGVKKMGHVNHVILGLNPSFPPSPSILLPNYYQFSFIIGKMGLITVLLKEFNEAMPPECLVQCLVHS